MVSCGCLEKIVQVHPKKKKNCSSKKPFLNNMILYKQGNNPEKIKKQIFKNILASPIINHNESIISIFLDFCVS